MLKKCRNGRTCGLAIAMLLGFLPAVELAGATYYLDSRDGDDAREGTTPEEAWRSLERANRDAFQPGDRILFRAGVTWDGTFQPHGSGSDGRPIIVDRYGEGA